MIESNLFVCVSCSIDPLTPAGQQEAQRVQSALNDLSRAVRVAELGPNTRMLNGLVELHKGKKKKGG